MTDDEIKQLIASNAKSIEALSNAIATERVEREKDRSQLFQYLGRIAAAQSAFYEVQADYYEQLAKLSERQAKLSERQTKIEERQIEMQEQINSKLIEILNRLTNKD